MNQDFNSNPGTNNPKSEAAESLADGLERLIRERETGAIASTRRIDPDFNQDIHDAMSPLVGTHCPGPAEWVLLLAEDPALEDQSMLDALLGHAASCDACAERLRSLSAPPTAEETATLANLSFGSKDRQKALAEKLARTPRVQLKRPGFRSYLWIGSAVAACLLLAISAGIGWRVYNNPERLLAQAYAQARIFDLRMPGAAYADVSPRMHLRGAGNNAEPPKLKAAQATIESRLQASPQDTHLLELEARSAIMHEKFDAAIDILDRLIAQRPLTADLLLDDASAYFQRGLATASESDRVRALECLRHADELEPGNPVILFNEALAMEDRGELVNAVETWNRYLRFERDPQWQAAGRRRLQVVEQNLNRLKAPSAN